MESIPQTLLLDGLDENREAIYNYQKFLVKLVNATLEFHTIIISCRTQFFSNELEEPKQMSFYSINTINKKVTFYFRDFFVAASTSNFNSLYWNFFNFLFIIKKIIDFVFLIIKLENVSRAVTIEINAVIDAKLVF